MKKHRYEEMLKYDDSKLFERIEPKIREYSTAKPLNEELFLICVKASLVKCFEFNRFVRSERASNELFFCLSALRGICEDLILLNFLKSWTQDERQEFLELHQLLDTRERLDLQEAFFGQVRPQQPVLSGHGWTKSAKEYQAELRAIWAKHNWTLKSGSMPQIRQIAERQSGTFTAKLY